MRVLIPALLASLALTATASGAARDGYWLAQGEDFSVRLYVDDGRVVSVLAVYPTQKVEGSAGDCGNEMRGFNGPLEPGNVSTRKRFAFDDPGWNFTVTGRVVSPRRIKGTVVDGGGNGDFCTARFAFTAKPQQ